MIFRYCIAISFCCFVFMTVPHSSSASQVDIVPASENIEKFFNALNRETMYLVEDFYDSQAEFYDPIVTIKGRDQLKQYYQGMYADVQSVEFEFTGEIKQGNDYVVFWTMILVTKKMNKGKPISVVGNSHIRFGGSEGKAIYHRDYFDVGAMVYEHVAVAGPLTRYIKKKLKKHAEPKEK